MVIDHARAYRRPADRTLASGRRLGTRVQIPIARHQNTREREEIMSPIFQRELKRLRRRGGGDGGLRRRPASFDDDRATTDDAYPREEEGPGAAARGMRRPGRRRRTTVRSNRSSKNSNFFFGSSRIRDDDNRCLLAMKTLASTAAAAPLLLLVATMVSAQSDSDHYFCGTSWADASDNCNERQHCQGGTDDECETAVRSQIRWTCSTVIQLSDHSSLA